MDAPHRASRVIEMLLQPFLMVVLIPGLVQLMRVPFSQQLVWLLRARARVLIRVFTEVGKISTAVKAQLSRC
jgi:hypothetical protein